MSDRWNTLMTIVGRVIEQPREKRDDLLRELCSGDAELLREARSLVVAHDQGDGLPGLPASVDDEAVPPERIGPYRLIEQIGEGGMGTVWVADQVEPVRRRVAVKLIKLGMDSREVIRRFETERQALAVMNHPNIAKVHDGGLSEDGRPYFAMEYVPGLAITTYCETYRLSLPERLELFAQVCRAIQHAHQKGILHRDIKPSNVLVASADEGAVPKVIDFGIAKAIEPGLTDHSVHTALHMVVGTPDYMSPEQADAGSVDIDSRTDVYSLGVLLYELLSGSRPFDSLAQLSLSERLRALQEDQPPRPSTRLRELDSEECAELAHQRKTSIHSLRRELSRDLDWIVLRAMDKDRTRRYASASELAADVDRYLAGQPVDAGPPSLAYRVGKFVRRHRSGVTVAALSSLAIVSLIVGMWIQTQRLQTALGSAERERQRAARVSTFMSELFMVADPGEDSANRLTAREVLDRGVERIDSELEAEPDLKAALLESMGTVYMNLGLLEQGRELFEESLDLHTELYGQSGRRVGQSLNWLGSAQARQGDLDVAIANLQRGLEILERDPRSEPRDVAGVLWSLGSTHFLRGELEHGLELLQRALPLHRQGGPHKDQALILSNIGAAQMRLGDAASAEATFTDALRLLDENYPGFVRGYSGTRVNLAFAKQRLGDLVGAETILVEELERLRATYGEPHQTIARVLSNLGTVRSQLGRPEEAEQSMVAGLRMIEALRGEEHPDTIRGYNNLALFFIYSDRRDEAVPWLEQSLAVTEAASHPAILLLRARALQLSAMVASHRGDLDQAELWSREGLDLRQAVPPPDDFDVQRHTLLLGDIVRRSGRFEEAEELLLSAFEKLHGSGKEEISSLQAMIDLYSDWGRPEEVSRYRAMSETEE